MRTIISAEHVVDVVGQPIAQPVATLVCIVLRGVEHLPVTADVAFDGTVHLRPARPMSTFEEVTALRAFLAVTDAPLRWHPAVTS